MLIWVPGTERQDLFMESITITIRLTSTDPLCTTISFQRPVHYPFGHFNAHCLEVGFDNRHQPRAKAAGLQSVIPVGIFSPEHEKQNRTHLLNLISPIHSFIQLLIHSLSHSPGGCSLKFLRNQFHSLNNPGRDGRM
jgi:hypothetical protein